MKRDLDLARRLLIEIENRGVDCSVSVLRSGPNQEVEERVRYHLRLLVDAGLLKEVDRTSNGIPCLRLTYQGHELLDLARDEYRWQEARRIAQQRTGGQSWTVIRTLLLRWAVEGPRVPPRRYRPAYYYPRRAAEALRDDHAGYGRGLSDEAYRYDGYLDDRRDWEAIDDVRYFRVRPEYRDQWRRTGIDLDGDGQIDVELEPALPDYLI